jgi:hypothetical protein
MTRSNVESAEALEIILEHIVLPYHVAQFYRPNRLIQYIIIRVSHSFAPSRCPADFLPIVIATVVSTNYSINNIDRLN